MGRLLRMSTILLICVCVEPALQENDADRKLRELILYISWCCRNHGNIGATKLNKILFYSDFAAYLKLGKPITGQDYFALQTGPAPKRLLPVREDMEERGEITLCNVQITEDYCQQLIVPQRTSDLSDFTAEEIAIVHQMMVRFFWKSAKATSEESHKFIGWIAAELHETIPYSSALLDAPHILGTEPVPISKDQIQNARGLEEKAKLLLDEYG